MIDVTEGTSPLLLGLPHTGTEVPAEIHARLNEAGRALIDTDWHIDRLYAGLVEGVSSVRMPVHRYVIDVNRDPDGRSLYPGQNTTDLIPMTDFDGLPIWRDGAAPGPEDVAARLEAFHKPYHAALSAQLARIKRQHGFALLYDCHSIRSNVPRLFEGTLPDFNIGTNDGATAASEIETQVTRICHAAEGHTTAVNARFKGGWTTRHHGRPETGIHAIQMELAQSAYLEAEAPPWRYDPRRAEPLRRHLTRILETLRDWRPA
ncbi:MAG: N-formylglutamate deformylase [Pseudomonadota bacterium]